MASPWLSITKRHTASETPEFNNWLYFLHPSYTSILDPLPCTFSPRPRTRLYPPSLPFSQDQVVNIGKNTDAFMKPRGCIDSQTYFLLLFNSPASFSFNTHVFIHADTHKTNMLTPFHNRAEKTSTRSDTEDHARKPHRRRACPRENATRNTNDAC